MSAIEIRGLDHVVLRIQNLERSIAFYQDGLGCSVERKIETLGLTQLRAGTSLIDLVEVSSPLGKAGGEAPDRTAPNMDHFAIELASFDEAAIRAHLAKHGIAAGDTGRRYGAGGYGASIYLNDPDGNSVELKGPQSSDPTPGAP
jgi:glyoxylase I family protein